jgi:hypothetical protein
LAAHAARVCGRCEDSRRCSTCEEGTKCQGCATRRCTSATLHSEIVHGVPLEDVISRLVSRLRPGNAHRAQSMLPAAWCFDNSPLANDDAPDLLHRRSAPSTGPAEECPSAVFPIRVLATAILVPRSACELAAEEFATPTAAGCPWMCNAFTSFLDYLSPKQMRRNLDNGCPWRLHTHRCVMRFG